MVSVVFRSFSLLSAENLVRVDANLPTSVGNIEATLAGRDQTRCQTALVVSSPIVQQLSIASTTRGYGVWWNAVAAIHPYISVASEHLVAGLLEFVSAEANVGGSLARHHLGRQHFTLVHCPWRKWEYGRSRVRRSLRPEECNWARPVPKRRAAA